MMAIAVIIIAVGAVIIIMTIIIAHATGVTAVIKVTAMAGGSAHTVATVTVAIAAKGSAAVINAPALDWRSDRPIPVTSFILNAKAHLCCVTSALPCS